MNSAFNARASELGVADLANYFWYHTVELPGGLVTPGQYDFRQTIDEFQFPQDMRGMRVLDVGSATGYFAFEFARRGATVVSVELPSLYALDRFPGQDIEQTLEKLGRMIVAKGSDALDHLTRLSADQLYFYLLEGPFEFCRKRLGLPIERCYSTIYGLTDANTGGAFDLVFLGDILLHTLHPLQALCAVAPLCRGSLMVAQTIPDAPDDQAAFQYVGGDSPDSDEVSWWLPNKPCMVSLLKKLGFARVEDVGRILRATR